MKKTILETVLAFLIGFLVIFSTETIFGAVTDKLNKEVTQMVFDLMPKSINP